MRKLRDLLLGGAEEHGGEDVPRATITHEHGAFIVRGFDPTGKRYSGGFKALGDARQYAREIIEGIAHQNRDEEIREVRRSRISRKRGW